MTMTGWHGQSRRHQIVSYGSFSSPSIRGNNIIYTNDDIEQLKELIRIIKEYNKSKKYEPIQFHKKFDETFKNLLLPIIITSDAFSIMDEFKLKLIENKLSRNEIANEILLYLIKIHVINKMFPEYVPTTIRIHRNKHYVIEIEDLLVSDLRLKKLTYKDYYHFLPNYNMDYDTYNIRIASDGFLKLTGCKNSKTGICRVLRPLAFIPLYFVLKVYLENPTRENIIKHYYKFKKFIDDNINKYYDTKKKTKMPVNMYGIDFIEHNVVSNSIDIYFNKEFGEKYDKYMKKLIAEKRRDSK